MSYLRLILASLLHHGRTHLAVACGVAAGTAVLTGALLVGDSMRGSLRHLTLDRLGRIDEALVADHFFREDLAQEKAEAAPAVLLRASLEKTGEKVLQVNQVNVVGCDARFWQLGTGGPERPPASGEVVINEPVAQQLDAAVGDTVVLRLPKPGAIPAESPLGQKRDTVRSVRLRVSEILAAEGLGRFALRPSQRLPRNAYVSLAQLQRELDEPGRVNAIVAPSQKKEEEASGSTWHPRLADYGIHLARTRLGYVNITTERMLWDPAAEKAVRESLAGRDIQPALTYLANTIACGERSIPYSTITAIDFRSMPPLGPMVSPDGKPLPPLADDQIALNSWAADDLHARPGDTIRVSYFEPESTHGQVRQRTADFRLAAIVALAGAADDPALTPSVRGITDQLSMSNWDPPFPFDARRVRPKDEKYWRDHRTAPKAMVSLATGRRLWGSRFGQTTSLRVAVAAGTTAEDIERTLSIDPAVMGFVFQPVKQQGLAASAGTTPFGVLFLGFSSFVIAAAVMLVLLLFRLGIDRRAAEAGILLAVGFRARQVAWLLAGEGLLVAALGSLLGTAAGIGYAALMLAGLRTWWLAAVSTPFLQLYISPWSLVIGFASGLVLAFAAIATSARRFARIAPRRLLAGDVGGGMVKVRPPLPLGATNLRSVPGGEGSRRRMQKALGRTPGEPALTLGHHVSGRSQRARGPYIGRRTRDVLLLALAIAPATILLAFPLDAEVQAGAFFGAGALSLGALLSLTYLHLRAGATGAAIAPGRGNLLRMALRNAARNPGRSGLSIGLAASACFLISAVSAFRLNPNQDVPSLQSGNGGFALVAESDQPLYHDLGAQEGRAQLGFPPEEERLLAQCAVFSLRAKPGDDASCLNLYQPQQPRLLGLPRNFLDRGGFAWTDAPPKAENPWLLLTSPACKEMGTGTSQEASSPPHRQLGSEPVPISSAEGSSAVPVVMDQNTANYSLHLWMGRGEQFSIRDSRDRPLRLEVAGLLGNSIFQGDLLVSEESLLRYDPTVSGYRFFLIEAPPEKVTEVRQALERNLGDYGFATETTADRLAGFLAVQNTYLSTFQSLGGLGLLLGTVGLAALQLRNVLERRGELALLRAAGFRRALLMRLVVLENVLLLVAGLVVGTLSALVAVLPQVAGHGASIPWGPLGAILGLVLVIGCIASLAAVRAVARAPLLAALRDPR